MLDQIETMKNKKVEITFEFLLASIFSVFELYD